MQFAGVGVKKH